MINRIKQDWQQFKQSRPGHRFQDRYKRRQREERGRWSAGKVFNVFLGLVIITGGIVLVAAPGPGWITVFIGLGFIASEFAPVARLLDWAEMKGRTIAEWGKDFWDRSSLTVKVLIVLLAVAVVTALAYGAYYVLFGGSR
jgi:uncharacterized protein (TIGR02611 family)